MMKPTESNVCLYYLIVIDVITSLFLLLLAKIIFSFELKVIFFFLPFICLKEYTIILECIIKQ